MKLYGLKTCDSCRKARKALPQAAFVDVREAGVPDDVLARALETFGAALVNRKSTTWRALGPEEQALAPEQLLAAHPTVMKRPLIVAGDQMTLGWAADAQAHWGS